MRWLAVALLAAVELGGAFGSASATVESIDDASMVVALEVEVTVSAQAVVAHLTFAEEPSRPLSLLNRGAGVFGIRTELERKNYIVVFEVIGEQSELSEPKTLSELGADLVADLVADREGGDPDPEGEQSSATSQLGWLALALGAASLSALAFWALGGREKAREHKAEIVEEE